MLELGPSLPAFLSLLIDLLGLELEDDTSFDDEACCCCCCLACKSGGTSVDTIAGSEGVPTGWASFFSCTCKSLMSHPRNKR